MTSSTHETHLKISKASYSVADMIALKVNKDREELLRQQAIRAAANVPAALAQQMPNMNAQAQRMVLVCFALFSIELFRANDMFLFIAGPRTEDCNGRSQWGASAVSSTGHRRSSRSSSSASSSSCIRKCCRRHPAHRPAAAGTAYEHAKYPRHAQLVEHQLAGHAAGTCSTTSSAVAATNSASHSTTAGAGHNGCASSCSTSGTTAKRWYGGGTGSVSCSDEWNPLVPSDGTGAACVAPRECKATVSGTSYGRSINTDGAAAGRPCDDAELQQRGADPSAGESTEHDWREWRLVGMLTSSISA